MSPNSASDTWRTPHRINRSSKRGGLASMDHLRFEAFPHCRQLLPTFAQHPQSKRSDLEIPPGPASAFGRRISVIGCDVAFLFKTFERAVEGADCQRSAGSRFDFMSNRHAIAVVAEP